MSTTRIETAADLLAWLESLADRVPLHKARVLLAVPHPDYLGPDALDDAAAAAHQLGDGGHVVTLAGVDSRALAAWDALGMFP